jgi:ligand-binding sensor domain-containing protein
MMGVLQTGLELIASWALSNSDPANLLLLAVVYIRLSRNDDALQAKVDKVKSQVADLHSIHEGDS